MANGRVDVVFGALRLNGAEVVATSDKVAVSGVRVGSSAEVVDVVVEGVVAESPSVVTVKPASRVTVSGQADGVVRSFLNGVVAVDDGVVTATLSP